MILSVLLATVALCGLFLVVWAIGEALTCAAPKNACHIVPLQGECAQVEQTVRSSLHGLKGRICFVDRGLDAEAQMCVELLLRGRDAVTLCSPEQLADYIGWENQIGTGTD